MRLPSSWTDPSTACVSRVLRGPFASVYSTHMPTGDPHEIYSFSGFTLDVSRYELRGAGGAIRLERQPMELLILLLERRGQLVSRADIVARLWPKDVFVDVDTGINTAIRKIRLALADRPEAPAFVETVPGKGYRFVAAVEVAPAAPPRGSRRWPPARLAKGVVALGLLAGFVAYWVWHEPARVTLAVLPFENLGIDPDLDYLADGLAEDVIGTLGQVDAERLGVIGRTSIMRYKKTTRSLADIGRELGAQYLVESSLRSENGKLRVTTSLIRVRDQVRIWSASYDRERMGVLGLQRELSTAIAEQVLRKLSPDHLGALARRQTRNPEAYDLYLRGLNYANQRTPATTRQAVAYYERATKLDPDYALAWSGLADVYSSSPLNGDAPPSVMAPRSQEAAQHAVRADPDLAESQAALGAFKFLLEWDWRGAETALRRAIAVDPGYVPAHLTLGHLLSQAGRSREAAEVMRRAVVLDPLFAMSQALSSQVAFQAHNYTAALELAHQTTVIAPEFWIGHMMVGQASVQMADPDLASQALADAERLSGGNSKPVSLRGYFLARSGRIGEARDVLKTLEAAARERYVPPYAVALVEAGLGDHEAVFEWLDRAYVARDIHLIFLPVDPKWDPYRADPRFSALLARCGFAGSPQAAP